MNNCKDFTITKLKEILREKKKGNKNVKVSGNKATLCVQYLKYKTPIPNAPIPNAPRPNAPIPNAPMPNAPRPNASKPASTPRTQLYELTKSLAQSLNTIGDFYKLRNKLSLIVEQQMVEFKNKNTYITPQRIGTMLNNKVNMDEIVIQIRKINDESTREEVGEEVIEKESYVESLMIYKRIDQEKFLEAIGRTIDEGWLRTIWREQDEEIVVKKLLKNEPMHRVIEFLKKKENDTYWVLTSIVPIEYDKILELYSKKDILKLEKHVEIFKPL